MKIGTSRVEAFSDGVIAIVITIMVLELELPDVEAHQTSRTMLAHLHKQLPYFGAYVFSFIMIGIFWSNHHHMYHLLQKTDDFLLGLNLFFLFWMSLIPYATGLVGASVTLPVSVAIYSGIMLMTTLSLAIMRWHTLRRRLVHEDENTQLTRAVLVASARATRRSWIGVVAYLLAVPAAFLNVYIAYALMLVPPVILFIPHGIDDEKLADRIEEKNG